jgi:hypothetical protein
MPAILHLLSFSKLVNYAGQFSDFTATYYFGLAVFDNAQVRHAFQNGSTPFVFMPKP